MKKKLLLMLFSLIAVFSIAAEKNYSSEKVIFLPQEFYVGDLVEMRIVITPEEGVEVAEPENFPDSYWIRIENAEVMEIDGKYELRIYLRSYAPGIRTLPSIKFGDVVLRDIRIQTASVLAAGTPDLSPPAQQMLLPGTKYYIALFTGLIFLLPIFFIFFWTKLRNRIRFYLNEHRRKRPYRRFQRVLKELETGLYEKNDKEFYTILIDELRLYLTARGSIDYTSSTVRESSSVIGSDFGYIKENQELVNLLKLADEVKFGDKSVMAVAKETELVKISAIAEIIEEAASEGAAHVDL